MNKAFLLLGSNMGNSEAELTRAKQHIRLLIGPVQLESSLYQTAAWGNTEQNDFLNQVIIVHTTLNALQCIHRILHIELEMGRKRTVKNAPRVIDIDILYFNNEIIRTPALVVPHPAIQERRFVLTPLAEIAPQYLHPVFKQTNKYLLAHCSDPLGVKKIDSR